jgi:hypothetical protein
VAFGKQTEKPAGTSWGVFVVKNGVTTPIVETDPATFRVVHLQDLNESGQVLISEAVPGAAPGSAIYRAEGSGPPLTNLTPGMAPLWQVAAMNDAGVGAFFMESPQFGVYTADGSSPPQPASIKPEFSDPLFASVAINNHGLIAQYLVSHVGTVPGPFKIFLGEGDQPLVQEGGTFLGRTISGSTGIVPGSLNEAGQLTFALSLSDDPSTPDFDPLRVIVLATSVPEPQVWGMLLAGLLVLGAIARRWRAA